MLCPPAFNHPVGFLEEVSVPAGSALLFCGFILYDTSNLLHLYGPDDYVEASIALYLDIINLFLYLLEILRMLQGGDN